MLKKVLFETTEAPLEKDISIILAIDEAPVPFMLLNIFPVTVLTGPGFAEFCDAPSSSDHPNIFVGEAKVMFEKLLFR